MKLSYMVPKVIRHFTLVIITLLFSACAQVPVTPAIVSNTPTVGGQEQTSTTEIQATLTPTGESTPTPQEQVTIYANYGFRFTLLPGYQTVNQRIGGDLHLSLGIAKESDDTKGYTLTPIGLRVFEKSVAVNLIDWFAEKQGDCYARGEQPPSGVYFIDPRVDNEETFKGSPAIKYESGCWPVPYEIVIDRGKWVIALYYLRDYPIDYEADYNRILASLEFFEPETGAVETATPVPPTSTPIACLDEAAQPVQLPSRKIPLEVRFISDGNLWVWNQGGLPAQQISDTGDTLRFTFSPDGEVIAFERPIGDYPYGQYKIELWAIDRDGGDLRRLVSTEQFDEFLTGRHEAWMANFPRDLRWFSGTHQLSFGVYPYIKAVGAGSAAEGYWVVDLDTLALEPWAHPDAIDPYAPKEIPSPDGQKIALVDRASISLLNADGSIIRKDILAYPVNACGEGPCWGAPLVVWAPDSLVLRVLVWDEDAFGESFSAWEIPANGSSAQKLHTFSGMSYFSFISPNQDYIAYLRRVRPMSNDHELHLATFDGSQDVTYAEGYMLYFQGWAPDSIHFVYDLFSVHQPFLGSVCGDPSPLVAPIETPATQITWVDTNLFLFVVGQEGQPRQLRLGWVGEASILIGPFNGENAQFQFVPDEEALRGLK